MTTYQRNADRIAQRQKAYSGDMAAIRADASLSEQGKAEHLASLYLGHQKALQKIRDADAEEAQQEQIRLETNLFGLATSDPGAIIAHRDAADRASKVKTADEAMRMLSQAARTGDTGLARAMFGRAWEAAAAAPLESGGKAWRQVIDTYLNEVQPQAREQAERLDTLQARQRPTAQMRDRMLEHAHRPRELGNANAETVANAAAERVLATHPGVLPGA